MAIAMLCWLGYLTDVRTTGVDAMFNCHPFANLGSRLVACHVGEFVLMTVLGGETEGTS